MKTIKRKVLVVVLMLGTLLNYANNGIEFKSINAKKVKVVFNDVKKGHSITIIDNQGANLHTEEITIKGDITKVFDFSNLLDGRYTIELNKDYEILVNYFDVINNAVVFNDNLDKTIFKPVVKNENSLIMISKIAFDKEPMKVEIYYNDDIINTEVITGQGILKRVYKLDVTKKGNYKVIISNNKRSYYNNFKI